MTTITNKKENVRIQETMNIYGLTMADFKKRPFLDDGNNVSEKFIAFYLLGLEEQALSKAIREEDGEEVSDDVLYLKKEISCNVAMLQVFSADISEKAKRRIACITPFIGSDGAVKAVKQNENNGFTKAAKSELKIAVANLLRDVSIYMEAQTKNDLETQKESYVEVKKKLEYCYNAVVGGRYVRVKQEDAKKLLLSALDLRGDNNDGKKELIFTPEKVGRITAKILLLIGNSLNNKAVKDAFSSKDGEKVIAAAENAKKKEAEKAAKKEKAEKAELKEERKQAGKVAEHK